MKGWSKFLLVGLILAFGLVSFLGLGGLVGLRPIVFKLQGKAPYCSWASTLRTNLYVEMHATALSIAEPKLAVTEYDSDHDLELISGGNRPFWIRRSGSWMDGHKLLAYLLSDHERLAEAFSAWRVQKGDVVLDCGAHIGTFVDLALRRGARKVVAIEPEPRNLEGLRRNFAVEIASGSVVIYPKGVWSSDAQLPMYEAQTNSGHHGFLPDVEHGKAIATMDLTTIDRLVADLNLDRVDFVKIDIEGADREALAGARETLRKFGPRLMLDSDHRRDDVPVFSAVLQSSAREYEMLCGPCVFVNDRSELWPHVTFWRTAPHLY